MKAGLQILFILLPLVPSACVSPPKEDAGADIRYRRQEELNGQADMKESAQQIDQATLGAFSVEKKYEVQKRTNED